MKALAISDTQGYARFVAGQYQYSLVQRYIEYEFDDLCRAEGIRLTPWEPLGSGFLSGKYKRGSKPKEGRIVIATEEQAESWERHATQRNWQIIEAVENIANARSTSYPQIALACLQAQRNVSSTIPLHLD